MKFIDLVGIFLGLKYVELTAMFLILGILYHALKKNEKVFYYSFAILTFLDALVMFTLTLMVVLHPVNFAKLIVSIDLMRKLLITSFEILALIISVHGVHTMLREDAYIKTALFYLRWVFCALVVFLLFSVVEAWVISVLDKAVFFAIGL